LCMADKAYEIVSMYEEFPDYSVDRELEVEERLKGIAFR
jgi:hypothetical protein